MTLAGGGALREGLVYGMLHLRWTRTFGSRTLRNVQRRFIVDTDQAQRVDNWHRFFADQVKPFVGYRTVKPRFAAMRVRCMKLGLALSTNKRRYTRSLAGA